MRKVLIALAVGAAATVTACGGSSSDKAASTSAPTSAPTTAASSTASSAATTSAPGSSTTAAVSTTAGATTVDVTLSEWKVQAGGIKAGNVTFNAKNVGTFPHELLVLKGPFASLPKNPDGSVNEPALGAGVLVGKVDRFDAGATSSVSLNIPPGQYALICNLVGGGQSHAARGQVLDVTVA